MSAVAGTEARPDDEDDVRLSQTTPGDPKPHLLDECIPGSSQRTRFMPFGGVRCGWQPGRALKAEV